MLLSPVATMVARYGIVGSLLYGAYIAYSCPCSTLMSCHQSAFYAAAGAPLALTLLLNNV